MFTNPFQFLVNGNQVAFTQAEIDNIPPGLSPTYDNGRVIFNSADAYYKLLDYVKAVGASSASAGGLGDMGTMMKQIMKMKMEALQFRLQMQMYQQYLNELGGVMGSAGVGSVDRFLQD